MTEKTNALTLDRLNEAVRRDAAIRCERKLQPAGGRGDKVFPPTYAEGKYATEERIAVEDGKAVRIPCVLLDSVQSQANRIELALLEATRNKDICVPLVEVNFRGVKNAGLEGITSLEAPHRVADAILRDSMIGGVRFPESGIGGEWLASTQANATALLGLCPTALLLGIWFNPTGGPGNRGNLGTRFQRALTSEIVAIDVEKGVTTGGQSNPLNVATEAVDIYRNKAKMEWATEAKPGWEKSKPSEINHGSITPDLMFARKKQTIIREADGSPRVKGGVTMRHALQTVVISLPALRRLRFPLNGGANGDSDVAARTALAALGLCGAVLSIERGCDLRSRCLLIPEPGQSGWELVHGDGSVEPFSIDADGACALMNAAVQAAEGVGLPWRREPLRLTPSPELAELVQKSRTLAMHSPETTQGE